MNIKRLSHTVRQTAFWWGFLGAVLLLAGGRFLWLATVTAHGEPAGNAPVIAGTAEERNNIEVYRQAAPSVVSINARTSTRGRFGQEEVGRGSGSGVVVDAQGYILTNEHVVQGGQTLTVNLGGNRVYPARLMGSDPDTDLAVLKIEAPGERLNPVIYGDSDRLQVGQKVLAIGNPFGLDRTLTTGIISGLHRPLHAGNGRLIEDAVQTDAAINPGNSGGPLLNAQGQMIGVNAQILTTSGSSAGVGFAVPVNTVKRVVATLIEGRRVPRPRLGVVTRSVRELQEQGAQVPLGRGVVVSNVTPGSAAERAGLRATVETGDVIVWGDVIVSVNGQAVNTPDDLQRALEQAGANGEVQLEVFRSNRRQMERVKVRLQDAGRSNNGGNEGRDPNGATRPRTMP